MKNCYATLLALFFGATAFAQFQTSYLQGQQLETYLQGQGLSITNLVINCPDSSMIGTFNGANSNIGVNSGLIMASGDIAAATGPNNSGSMTLGGGIMNSDIDMDAIATVNTNDVCFIEFDATPQWNNIAFEYIFASEEYPEYVCSTFNDVFALLVSGPGISGPYSNGAINVALVPGTTTQVAINTVNPGVPGGGSAGVCDAIDPNWPNYNVYYVDNTNGTTVQYDGFTVPLTAYITLQSNQTYHFKIAIADAADAAFDSAVMLQESSFRSVNPNSIEEVPAISSVSVQPNPANEYLEVTYNARDAQQVTMDLIDLTGRTVYTQSQSRNAGYSQQRIELNTQKEGVYFLRLSGDDFKVTKRVVIKR